MKKMALILALSLAAGCAMARGGGGGGGHGGGGGGHASASGHASVSAHPVAAESAHVSTAAAHESAPTGSSGSSWHFPFFGSHAASCDKQKQDCKQ
jgi:hypothetical protein